MISARRTTMERTNDVFTKIYEMSSLGRNFLFCIGGFVVGAATNDVVKCYVFEKRVVREAEILGWNGYEIPYYNEIVWARMASTTTWSRTTRRVARWFASGK